MRETLLSVGIDIGTSTTQLVFSKLIMENMASAFAVPRIVIVEKEVIYKSAVYFTPLLSPREIDGQGVRDIIAGEYEKAGIDKRNIQTGAVIITGETARKENAREILAMLSGFAGDFVVATAGPDLESIIAGKGAGADVLSRERRKTIVNVDIGGGTSNLALFADGEVRSTGCLDIGGRLIRVDTRTHEITYIAPKLSQVICEKNMPLSIGTVANPSNLDRILDFMVRTLEQSLGLLPKDEDFSLMVTNKNIEGAFPIDGVTFSGGVADSIYEEATGDVFRYGDIGVLLGQAVRSSSICKKLEVLKGTETIRATVVGAGSHTTEISGSTITYTNDLFPIKNLPIAKLTREEENSGEAGIAKAVREKLQWFDSEEDAGQAAVALEGRKNPTFQEIQAYARGLAAGMADLSGRGLPLIVIMEQDMAKALGNAIYQEVSRSNDIICLDGIKLENGDYIDIGNPVADGMVVPVVIKTLVF